MNIFPIKNFFSGLILTLGFGGPHGSELNIIRKRLRKNHSQIFSVLSGKLKPQFAENLLILKENLDYYKPLFDVTFGLQEEKALIAFHRKLLDKMLHQKNINLKMLEFEEIKDEVMKINGRGLREIQQVFKSRFAAFTSLKTAKIHTSYLNVYRLWMLSSFDFEGILSYFGYAKAPETPVKFHECPAEKIFRELKDLYFLCADFTPDSEGLKLLHLVAAMNPDISMNEETIISNYAGIQEFLDRDLPLQVLGDIIKLSERNPDTELKIPEVSTNFIETIRHSIFENFRSERDIYQKSIAEKAYQTKIRTLFQSREISPIEGYTKDVSKLLVSNGLPGFLHVTALRLLKSFALFFYEDGIKEVYDNFLNKIGFISREFGGSLKNAVRSCNELLASIHKFESDLEDPKFSRLIPIIDKCTQKAITENDRKKFTKVIDEINLAAVKIVETGTAELFSILQAGLKSLEDIHAKNSSFVDNSRYMRDSEQRLLEDMIKSTAKLSQFMDIMSHFSINRKQIQKWRNNLEDN